MAPAVPAAWTISPLACQVCSNSMRRQCCPSLSTDPCKTVCKSCFQILSPSVLYKSDLEIAVLHKGFYPFASILWPSTLAFGEASFDGRGLYEQSPTGGNTPWKGVNSTVNPIGNKHGCQPKNNGTPKWMVKIRENPIKMDDLGGPPLFLETPTCYLFNWKNLEHGHRLE